MYALTQWYTSGQRLLNTMYFHQRRQKGNPSNEWVTTVSALYVTPHTARASIQESKWLRLTTFTAVRTVKMWIMFSARLKPLRNKDFIFLNLQQIGGHFMIDRASFRSKVRGRFSQTEACRALESGCFSVRHNLVAMAQNKTTSW